MLVFKPQLVDVVILLNVVFDASNLRAAYALFLLRNVFIDLVHLHQFHNFLFAVVFSVSCLFLRMDLDFDQGLLVDAYVSEDKQVVPAADSLLSSRGLDDHADVWAGLVVEAGEE